MVTNVRIPRKSGLCSVYSGSHTLCVLLLADHRFCELDSNTNRKCPSHKIGTWSLFIPSSDTAIPYNAGVRSSVDK